MGVKEEIAIAEPAVVGKDPDTVDSDSDGLIRIVIAYGRGRREIRRANENRR